MYALRRDVIDTAGKPLSKGGVASPGKVSLRPDLRPRPLVLRVAAGQCLKVNLQNLLDSTPNPFQKNHVLPSNHPVNSRSMVIERTDNQVFSRKVGFHPQGLELVRSINRDSSYVGRNGNSLLAPGTSRSYVFFAPHEGAFLVSNPGASFGGEATSGNSGVGLFGLVAVQPKRAEFYRSMVTEEELRLSTHSTTIPNSAKGRRGLQPVINYEETYPDDCATNGVWCQEGKAGLPILKMVTTKREIVHGDVNAIIAGPGMNKAGEKDGSFPPDTYPLESIGKRNPSLPNRLEAFREFASIYHDENAAAQAFPKFFDDKVLGHTLHGVRDAFMINYGSGGVGSEIIANRIGVGPMHDCVDCAYEEFFLASSAVGDPAMLVDKPANIGIEDVAPGQQLPPEKKGPKATMAYYPHDPANVHHSYMGDFVKFRNVHTGKEQHIFHLHNHQWLFNPNDDNSNYIDAQGIGPGSGYTYEIAFGGSGNRNKTAGDAIFHCHLYPHFAQGMWYMWRIHDVYETGTRLAVSGKSFHEKPWALKDGLPARGARALPDGEIAAGTPIPAVVPLPGKALPIMPGQVALKPKKDLNGKTIGSLANVIDRKINPGYPFWIAGVEDTVGSRPPTPPLDMLATAGGFDGGLPRHAMEGYSAGSEAHHLLNRLTAEHDLITAKPKYFPEDGTELELIAMEFHGKREHPSEKQTMNGVLSASNFIANGKKPVAGAPYHDPCIDDTGEYVRKDVDGKYFNATGMMALGTSQFDAATPRTYKGANIQLDVVFNKVGYHYPQQRILTLWEDVGPTLDKTRPPEPFVMRMNTFDCANYLHTNLIPKNFELDDYQITTPTDVIGQHIHLPKWDLTSADGSANGWNYEDGTFSPQMVRERIVAINHYNAMQVAKGLKPVLQPNMSKAPLQPKPHDYFGKSLPEHQKLECEEYWAKVAPHDHESLKKWEEQYGKPGSCDWLGARTTIQRWFSDPVINVHDVHRGLGITFTHDHLGPSTHQQIGLYATMLTEPPGSAWKHNEKGYQLGADPITRAPANDPITGSPRGDGGPTSWQAMITGSGGTEIDVDKDKKDDSHREFFLQFGDFQHAYLKDVWVGVNSAGEAKPPTPDDFRSAINPSFRKPNNPIMPDLVAFPAECPGGVPRPCPEAISADDIGMMVVNYRNEPIGLRAYDPSSKSQAIGLAGDLSFATQTRTDRKILQLNTKMGDTPYPLLTSGILDGDPFTPIARAYSGDLVKVKIQAGAHEHEHNGAINAMRWLQGGSGYGKSPNSGWRGAQNAGLSEQFTLSAPITDYETKGENASDRMYTIDSSQDGMWSGVWGVIRTYNRRDPASDQLQTLPSKPLPLVLAPGQGAGLLNECPKNVPIRHYNVSAVLANKALGNDVAATIQPGRNVNPNGGTLVYNNRPTDITIEYIDEKTGQKVTQKFGSGPLHDPTAIMFVRTRDLELKGKGKIKAGRPVEPIVLRANAGECIQIVLTNELPPAMPDLDGYTSIMPIVRREPGSGVSPMTTFNNNRLRPSSEIGLHPQMLWYDVQSGDGNNVGINKDSTVASGGTKIYQWYAGTLDDPAMCERRKPALDELQPFNIFPRNPRLRPLTDLNTADAVKSRAFALAEELGLKVDRKALEPGGVFTQATNLAATLGCIEPVETLDLELTDTAGVPLLSAQNSRSRLNLDILKQANGPTSPISAIGLASIAEDAAFSDKIFDRLGAIREQRLKCGEQINGLTERFARIFANLASAPDVMKFSNLFAQSFTLAVESDLGFYTGNKEKPSGLGWLKERYPDMTPETTMVADLRGARCEFKGIEYGGINLSPPDRIKQGQKGAVGALVVLPRESSWVSFADDWRIDHQKPFSATPSKRATRATATVQRPVDTPTGQQWAPFRDYAVVHQKALNFRYKKGNAVQNLAAEKVVANETELDSLPEDSHDAGHMAINYGSEPMWFRFGLPPDAPFGKEGFGGIPTAWQSFSNKCCAPSGTSTTTTSPVGDPLTGVFEVPAGMEARMRVLMPTGVGRATVFNLHGHPWPRDPHVSELNSGGWPNGGGGVGSMYMGHNPMSIYMGGQESVTPQAHFDIYLDSAGGTFGVPGDYLFRDMGGFGLTNGLWGIMRVQPATMFGTTVPTLQQPKQWSPAK